MATVQPNSGVNMDRSLSLSPRTMISPGRILRSLAKAFNASPFWARTLVSSMSVGKVEAVAMSGQAEKRSLRRITVSAGISVLVDNGPGGHIGQGTDEGEGGSEPAYRLLQRGRGLSGG